MSSDPTPARQPVRGEPSDQGTPVWVVVLVVAFFFALLGDLVMLGRQPPRQDDIAACRALGGEPHLLMVHGDLTLSERWLPR